MSAKPLRPVYGLLRSPLYTQSALKHTHIGEPLPGAHTARTPALAQANVQLDEIEKIAQDFVNALLGENSSLQTRDNVPYMDISPKQFAFKAASLIPFLENGAAHENGGANRALVGSTMRGQAVPVLLAEEPYIGTVMKCVGASDPSAVEHHQAAT